MALPYGEKRHLCTKGSAVHDQRGHLRQRVVFLVSLCVLVTAVAHGRAADILASNKQPLSFGPGQTIIDLKKIVWEPLTGRAFPQERRSPPSAAIWPKAGVSCWSTCRPTTRFPIIVIPVKNSMSGSRELYLCRRRWDRDPAEWHHLHQSPARGPSRAALWEKGVCVLRPLYRAV